MAVMAPLLSPLVGGSGTGSNSLSVKSCVVMSGCAVPTDDCLVVTVVDTISRSNTSACSFVSSYLPVQFPQITVLSSLLWTLSGRDSTSACSFCVVILGCTHPTDACLVVTVVDTVK